MSKLHQQQVIFEWRRKLGSDTALFSFERMARGISEYDPITPRLIFLWASGAYRPKGWRPRLAALTDKPGWVGLFCADLLAAVEVDDRELAGAPALAPEVIK